jgi:hypothetical protein
MISAAASSTSPRASSPVADPDEWDDFENNSSQYNTFLTTPSIALAGPVTTASLSFASSWRPEGFDDACSDCPGGDGTNNQTAVVNAVYSIAGVPQAPVEVLRWDSNTSGPFFHPDEPNEAVSLTLSVPVNADSVKFEFNLARSPQRLVVGNRQHLVRCHRWFFSIFSENFEGVPNKQAPLSENPAGPALCAYFSDVATQGLGFTAGGTRTWLPRRRVQRLERLAPGRLELHRQPPNLWHRWQPRLPALRQPRYRLHRVRL